MKKYILPNILIAVVMMISFAIMPVFASNEDSSYSLTVAFVTEDGVMSDVDFKLYEAFDQSGNVTGDFAGYNIDDNVFTTGSLGDLALTLASYAARDNIPAYAESATDSDGLAQFNGLPDGIYLVVGDTVVDNGNIYSPKPFIISVPYSTDSGEVIADVYTEVKYEVRPVDDRETISRSVIKIWNDNNDEHSMRPDSVTVNLLKDGVVYDSVVLSDDNNWRYTWDELDADANWMVTEARVPEGYGVRISLEGELFTITNSNITAGDTTSSEQSSSSDTDSSSSSSTPDSSSTSSTPTPPAPNNSVPPTLPQTGQLWWPVPVMFFLGFAVLLAGIVVTKIHEENS